MMTSNKFVKEISITCREDEDSFLVFAPCENVYSWIFWGNNTICLYNMWRAIEWWRIPVNKTVLGNKLVTKVLSANLVVCTYWWRYADIDETRSQCVTRPYFLVECNKNSCMLMNSMSWIFLAVTIVAHVSCFSISFQLKQKNKINRHQNQMYHFVHLVEGEKRGKRSYMYIHIAKAAVGKNG